MQGIISNSGWLEGKKHLVLQVEIAFPVGSFFLQRLSPVERFVWGVECPSADPVSGDASEKYRMLVQEFTIINKLGLHARASALLVKTASRFKSDIRIERENVEVNGKSIMGIMMLAAAKGTTVQVTIGGEDEAEAMQALGDLIRDGFGEE
ncbi:MAG: phosphocarrier protein HPr [Geobacteraceae bacterium]|nr:phosphocarrier protein HPr [Geobacteraceae bacterium]